MRKYEIATLTSFARNDRFDNEDRFAKLATLAPHCVVFALALPKDSGTVWQAGLGQAALIQIKLVGFGFAIKKTKRNNSKGYIEFLRCQREKNYGNNTFSFSYSCENGTCPFGN